MARTVLITGGAGFIGSHVADRLLAAGYRVRALDELSSQVHGPNAERPVYLSPEVELLVGDVRSPQAVRKALENVDLVLHLAARVGVGQSMYQVADYTSVNNLGTAVLFEELAKSPVERLVVASSMSVYGEGLYRSESGQLVSNAFRTATQLKEGAWEPRCSEGKLLHSLPTPESKEPSLASVYALSKYDQERLCLVLGRSYGIPTLALRFFNVYGPRQALSNPYTGVLANFASRLMNRKRPLIFEDGLQKRDFVSVHDVARACQLALESSLEDRVFNIGSGKRQSVRQVASSLAKVLGCSHIDPELTGNYRAGDIRHCFADIRAAKDELGFEPQVELEEGLLELSAWLEGQVAHDRVEEAAAELAQRGLTL